jgi:Tfp pilus assembly protein FimV
MAKPPPEDPRVTDLRRYKQEREKAARKPAPKPKAPKASFLGSNPRAGLILAAVILVLAALYLLPAVL